jgi:hypothetical protein
MAKHLPRGKGYRIARPNGQEFVASLIKWVRMNERASIAMFKVNNPKKRKTKTGRAKSTVPPSGKLQNIEAVGKTYITLQLDEGTITLTPTSNREQNRDIVAKALKALL